MSEKGQEIGHIDEAYGNVSRSWRDKQWGDQKLSVAAHDVANEEKEMSMIKAIKTSKKAILWSLAVSTCVIMEGCKLKSFHDTILARWGAQREVGTIKRLTELIMDCLQMIPTF